MATLTVKEVLLSYESPLVVLATNARQKQFVGVNYGDSRDGYQFYFSGAQDDSIRGFVDGAFDLLYLLTRKHTGKYQVGISWGNPGHEVSTRPIGELLPSMLPKPGVFNYDYAHTCNAQTMSDATAIAMSLTNERPIEHRNRQYLPPPPPNPKD